MACVHTGLWNAERRVRLDLGRFEFSAREWCVLNVLLLECLNVGREQVPVNGLDDLVKRVSWATGMRTDHCRETLRGLFQARVLVHDVPFTFCMVDVDSQRWGVRERHRAEEPSFARGVNGELFPGPCVAAEVARSSIQDRAGELPAGPSRPAVSRAPQVGEGDGPEGLPESGRTLPKSGNDRCGATGSVAPQIGEDAMKPLQYAGERVVLPKSGRGCEPISPSRGAPQVGECNVVQRLNVSENENVLNVVTLPVPKSGSASRTGQCEPHGPVSPSSHRDEGLLIARLRQFLGEEEWGYYGGAWVTHGVRKSYGILERALNDCEQTVREGRIRVRHRGRYLWRIFGLFGGREEHD